MNFQPRAGCFTYADSIGAFRADYLNVNINPAPDLDRLYRRSLFEHPVRTPVEGSSLRGRRRTGRGQRHRPAGIPPGPRPALGHHLRHRCRSSAPGGRDRRDRRLEIGTDLALRPAEIYIGHFIIADPSRFAILGIGSGWFKKDHDEYGYDLSDSQRRLDRLHQSLEAIRYRPPRLDPPPAGELPIMIGNGGDRKPPEMVARHADIWMDFKTPETVRAYNRELNSACGLIGRDPQSIERGIAISPNDLAKTPEFLDAGCTLFMVRVAGPRFDLSFLKEWTGWRDAFNGLTACRP
ncbi:hypothetical protein CHELA40_10669 [Chelatococcus asaccharovorans]|nr:hypothetical protein CHELA40_10669 [Chelatococcus asaccharovorans]CAH1686299.1 hypothetical protein CHELA17_64937 [Chelatococcus asaccharovorans]